MWRADGTALTSTQSANIDATLAAATRVRAPMPAFVAGYLPKQSAEAYDPAAVDVLDFASMLAGSIRWYMEFPHVDAPFRALDATLPGHIAAE